MKAKKNIAQQVMLYIILFGIILTALCYFFVYKSFEDKAAKIKNNNNVLQARVAVLKTYYDAMADNQNAIDVMDDEILSMLDEFDADDIKEEDVIMQAVKTLPVSDIEYTAINITDRESFKTIGSDVVVPAEIEGLDTALIMVKRNATYVSSVDYINLKQCIAELNKRPSRSTITNMTFEKSKDEKVLEGTIEYDFYYVIGTPKEYVPLQIKDYKAGLEDIFKLEKPEVKDEEVISE